MSLGWPGDAEGRNTEGGGTRAGLRWHGDNCCLLQHRRSGRGVESQGPWCQGVSPSEEGSGKDFISKRVAKTNLHCAHLPAAGIWRRLGQMVPGAVGEADCPEAEDLRGGFWEVNPLLISEPASRDRGPSLHPFTPIICSPHPHFSDLHFSPRLPFSPPSFRDLFLVIIALPLDR